MDIICMQKCKYQIEGVCTKNDTRAINGMLGKYDDCPFFVNHTLQNQYGTSNKINVEYEEVIM